MFDVVIKNGQVIDGTGNPWFNADIGIENGKIECISRYVDPGRAKRIINADGLTVSPGFIDAHCHDDLYLLKYPSGKGKILQGVTTLINGNCGFTAAPVLSQENKRILRGVIAILGSHHIEENQWDWLSFGDYLRKLEELKLGINVATLVGHATVRIAVLGMEQRAPTNDELERMKKLVGESMEEGAYGMSTGLTYTPATYATTEEVIELARVVAKYNGIYASHIRNESNSLLPAIAEAIKIGEESGCPVHIAHFKVSGKKNWGKSSQSVRMLEDATERGIETTCDQYSYTAGSSFLAALLPPAIQAGGPELFCEKLKDIDMRKKVVEELEKQQDQWQNQIQDSGWENIVISYSTNHPNYHGKSIMEISAMEGKSPHEIMFDLIVAEAQDTIIIAFIAGEEDIKRIMSGSLTMVGSDGIPDFGDGKIHPRFYGTFPRVLGKYVREEKVLTLPEAIKKMTSLPAQTFGLQTKGVLRSGLDADIVIFDPRKIIDKATYDDPIQPPEGIHYVIVNGEVALQNGELTGAAAGRVLKYRK